MANPEQLEILKSGVENWNKWREENRTIEIDLSHSSFDYSELSKYNFINSNLRNSSFKHTNLQNIQAFQADLSHSDLTGADLSNANLLETLFINADLSQTSFKNAYLSMTTFTSARLSKSDFKNAIFSNKFILYNDLSNILNLDKTIHHHSSSLDIHTIYKSKGNIPVEFLKGVGMDDQMISFVQSLKGAIQFYSCFISYSRENDDFATLLHDRLQGTGIRCWKDTKDLKTGDFIEDSINKAIKTHEKVLIILSKESINSKWVRREVKNALDRETKENKKILFPINIDNTVFEDDSFWVKDIRLECLITDFSKWKDHDDFEKAFQKITADLKASENNTESPSTSYI